MVRNQAGIGISTKNKGTEFLQKSMLIEFIKFGKCTFFP